MQHILVGLRFSVLCVPRLFDWRYERGATDCGEVDITYRGSHSKTMLLETEKSELCCAVQIRVILETYTERYLCMEISDSTVFSSEFIRKVGNCWGI